MKYYIANNDLDFILTQNTAISYHKHTHSSMYIIGIVLKGYVNLQINSLSTKYQENNFFIVPPNTLHAITISDNTTNMLTVCVKDSFVKKNKNNGILTVYKFINKLKNFEIIKNEHIQIISKAYTTILQQYICHDLTLPTEIEYAKTYVIKYSQEVIDINKLSEITNYSKYYLIRKFCKCVGLTPHKFQIQQRIRKSQKILLQGKTIAETAILSGFYDQSHYIKAFRQIVGITPKQYICCAIHLERVL